MKCYKKKSHFTGSVQSCVLTTIKKKAFGNTVQK